MHNSALEAWDIDWSIAWMKTWCLSPSLPWANGTSNRSTTPRPRACNYPVMQSPRPDPDALLAKLAAEEVRAARGKLKIFFGASPGVGKTYAMLVAAGQLRAQGVDVVVARSRPRPPPRPDSRRPAAKCARRGKRAPGARQAEGLLRRQRRGGQDLRHAVRRAAAARRRGVDVVVGVVETHGRSETAALLEGLEVLPLEGHRLPRPRCSRSSTSMRRWRAAGR